MQGIQYIRLQSKRLSYDLELRHKVNIIQGDSGIGKTTLIGTVNNSIRRHMFKNTSTKELDIIDDRSVARVVSHIRESKDCICLMDEDTPGITSKEVAEAINDSDCCFVIIHRYPLSNIPYSIDAVYTLETIGTKHVLKNRFSRSADGSKVKPQYIICEDSKSGFILFKLIDTLDKYVNTSRGKSNIIDMAIDLQSSTHSRVLIIADGAAFGDHIERLISAQTKFNIAAYLPESTEFLLLHSVIFKQDVDLEQLIHTVDTSFISSEQMYTQILKQKMQEIGLTYSKSGLNRCFVDSCCPMGVNCIKLVKDRSIDKLDTLLEEMPIDFSLIYIDKKRNTLKRNNTEYLYD